MSENNLIQFAQNHAAEFKHSVEMRFEEVSNDTEEGVAT